MENVIQILIRERQQFEDEMYDLLISPMLFIPEDFWEPVKVGLSKENINKMETVNTTKECFICKTDQENFKILSCCKNDNICHSCIDIWFGENVKCPYCKQDLREF
jgi:hypothetical protein